jgi:hypothetical protein
MHPLHDLLTVGMLQSGVVLHCNNVLSVSSCMCDVNVAQQLATNSPATSHACFTSHIIHSIGDKRSSRPLAYFQPGKRVKNDKQW